MAQARTYSDQQLATAISTASSWRGTLRALGLVATSAGSMRSLRAHADRLGIDYSHFVGQRRWAEDDLRAVIDRSVTWPEVTHGLGLAGESAISSVKGHADRLRIDASHLSDPTEPSGSGDHHPNMARLDRAGSLLAAAWFTLCGHDVAWPLEPSRYDLVVHSTDGIRRVQVKTTTSRAGDSWKVYLSTSRRERRTYTADEIDAFFIIDGDLTYYLIPLAAVGGLHAIHLRGYAHYRVEQAKRS